MSTPPFLTLPTELIHCIIDHLDDKTTLFSLRYVCKFLYKNVESYNRYRLDFRSIAKPKFHQICSLIQPQNIISLALSDADETPGQIGLFLSLFNVYDFTRLRSLTLIQIEESHLIIFLKHISPDITSLSIDHQDSLNLSYETIELHSSTIAKLRLHQLHMTTANFIVINIQWPIQYPLQYLTLNRCSCKQYINILRRLPHLQTLIMLDFSMNDSDIIFTSYPELELSPQLKSLTIKSDLMLMHKIQRLLSLTSSLIRVELVSLTRISDSIFGGSQWERFIQMKCPDLEKFEFFFWSFIDADRPNYNIQAKIEPFRTPFWLEYKRWFVNCTSVKNKIVQLYSLPICESSQTYDFKINKVSCSTLTSMDNDGEAIMDNVSHLCVNLDKISIGIISEQNEPTNGPLYRKVANLSLRFDDSYPAESIHYLSLLIDMSHLVQLSLSWLDYQKSLRIVKYIIDDLLQRAPNVHTLQIDCEKLQDDFEEPTGIIISILSEKIKFIKLNVGTGFPMRSICTQYRPLSSVMFKSSKNLSKQYDEIINCLQRNNRDFTYRKQNCFLGLWFGKNK